MYFNLHCTITMIHLFNYYGHQKNSFFLPRYDSLSMRSYRVKVGLPKRLDTAVQGQLGLERTHAAAQEGSRRRPCRTGHDNGRWSSTAGPNASAALRGSPVGGGSGGLASASEGWCTGVPHRQGTRQQALVSVEDGASPLGRGEPSGGCGGT
jgi:hypothetical protein